MTQPFLVDSLSLWGPEVYPVFSLPQFSETQAALMLLILGPDTSSEVTSACLPMGCQAGTSFASGDSHVIRVCSWGHLRGSTGGEEAASHPEASGEVSGTEQWAVQCVRGTHLLMLLDVPQTTDAPLPKPSSFCF